jgi:lantibiotic transport system permease protein
MTLLRALHAEALKMKRTIALKMVVLSPAVIVVLIVFVASQAPFSMLRLNGIGNAWMVLVRRNLMPWALLMLPLFIALETALVAGLDHSENQWKSLLARPVPRWTLYVAKLIVVTAMLAAATLTLLCGILLGGAILSRVQSEVVFGFPVPWAAIFGQGAQIAGLSFLALTIQHWVSLRWRSFSVAVGTGIVATVVGFFTVAVGRQLGDWPHYFPWALPMLVVARQPHNLDTVLCISFALGLIVSAAGCLDFCRREVT